MTDAQRKQLDDAIRALDAATRKVAARAGVVVDEAKEDDEDDDGRMHISRQAFRDLRAALDEADEARAAFDAVARDVGNVTTNATKGDVNGYRARLRIVPRKVIL